MGKRLTDREEELFCQAIVAREAWWDVNVAAGRIRSAYRPGLLRMAETMEESLSFPIASDAVARAVERIRLSPGR